MSAKLRIWSAHQCTLWMSHVSLVLGITKAGKRTDRGRQKDKLLGVIGKMSQTKPFHVSGPEKLQ